MHINGHVGQTPLTRYNRTPLIRKYKAMHGLKWAVNAAPMKDWSCLATQTCEVATAAEVNGLPLFNRK